jgi:predicted Rossmann-fold nucleotide-binding protein
MFEMVTWRQLRLHAKPVGLINVDGYFDHLLAFLQHAAQQDFIRPQHRDLLLVGATAAGLLERLLQQAGVAQGPALGDLERS